MIIRVVSMHFSPEHSKAFLAIFSSSRAQIRAFSGCHSLDLLADKQDPDHFSTLSHWESEEALEHYRHSVLFQSTWAKTKVLFDRKPIATSFQVWEG